MMIRMVKMAKRVSRKWTEREIAILERMAERFPPDKIVSNLRHCGFYRSENAVIQKLTKLKMSRQLTLDNISATKAGDLLGVDHSSISRWIKKGLLAGRVRGQHRGQHHYMIQIEDIKKMLLDPPKNIAARMHRFNQDGVKYLLDDY